MRPPEDPRRKAARGGGCGAAPGEGPWNAGEGGGYGAPSGAEPSASGVLTCRGAPRTRLRLRSTPAGPEPPRREAWCGPRGSRGGGRGWDGYTCLGHEVLARGPCPVASGGAGSCGRRVPRPERLRRGRAGEKRRLKGTRRWSAAAARAPSTLPPGGGGAHSLPSETPAFLCSGFLHHSAHFCSHFYFDTLGTQCQAEC